MAKPRSFSQFGFYDRIRNRIFRSGGEFDSTPIGSVIHNGKEAWNAYMIDVRYLRTSTLLIHWDELTILTDPWFAMHMRGLPVFVKPCIRPENLPALDLVLVSHLHPDHYDHRAMRKLTQQCTTLVGPPGIENKIDGVPCANVVTMVGGENYKGESYTVTAITVEHSGYENAYLVEKNECALLFAGDAKYNDAFLKIGRIKKPLVSLLPVGGTEIMGRRIVMDPKDAVQAAIDLGTKVMIPIHIGGEWMSVPPLSRHPGRARSALEIAKNRNDAPVVEALAPGERVIIDRDGKTSRPK